MREKPTSCKMTARESDIINVDDSSSHSTDSAGSIWGARNTPSNVAPLENRTPPSPNYHSSLTASEHSIFGLLWMSFGSMRTEYIYALLCFNDVWLMLLLMCCCVLCDVDGDDDVIIIILFLLALLMRMMTMMLLLCTFCWQQGFQVKLLCTMYVM